MTETEAKTKSDRKANRLIGETSPYLLQHAYNPVDWYPWGQEALKISRDQDKPILLSIGYAACHWCHVMEHESFEDESTAAFMNKEFVNIKVDREERPDLDDIYMKAIQMMTGHGGWPMTVFLTPELKPFFGGTYFPPVDRHGLPSFQRLLAGVSMAWKEQRDKIEESSSELTRHMEALSQLKSTDDELDRAQIDMAVDKMLHFFDPEWGGFGGAPKFPQTYTLGLIMRAAHRFERESESKHEKCRNVITTTLDKMAYGGMYDHLAGGFARYSVDNMWLVPHFEKMLYDNASLADSYLSGYQLFGRSYWLDIARGCLDFVLNELTTDEGAFYSSLDADSEGVEGKFYVWKLDEVIDVLGDEDGAWFSEVMGVTAQGNFEHGNSVLHLTDSPEKLARNSSMSVEDFWIRLNPLREKLLEARAKRVRPGRDEKVLTSWNGLMISAFVKGYRVTGDRKYLDAAVRASNFILEKLFDKGRLLRTWGKGKSKLNAYVEDYAHFVAALLDLSSVDTGSAWLEQAVKINSSMIDHFWDDSDGGLYFTSDDHEVLLTRTKSFTDGPTPSGASVAAHNFLRLAKLTNDADLRGRAETTVKLYQQHFEKAPDQFANLISALDLATKAGQEIVYVSENKSDELQTLIFAASQHYLPDAVELAVSWKTKDDLASAAELIEKRQPVDGKPAAYICRNYTCKEPVTDPGMLRAALKEATT